MGVNYFVGISDFANRPLMVTHFNDSVGNDYGYRGLSREDMKILIAFTYEPIDGIEIKDNFDIINIYREKPSEDTYNYNMAFVGYTNESTKMMPNWYDHFKSIEEMINRFNKGDLYSYYNYMYLLYIAEDADVSDKYMAMNSLLYCKGTPCLLAHT